MVSSGAWPRLAEGLPLRASARKGLDLEWDRREVDRGETETLRALAVLEAAVDLGMRLADQIKSNHFYCHITTVQVPW